MSRSESFFVLSLSNVVSSVETAMSQDVKEWFEFFVLSRVFSDFLSDPVKVLFRSVTRRVKVSDMSKIERLVWSVTF